MTEMTPEAAAALRRPFPPESIGKLPKGGMMLDYAGHAAVTDRLLSVDPAWTWEPLALDEAGLPALDRAGNLWLRLTVCGVTRIGVGDGKNAKECIGDALRNAAMRFGVALDLWARENLVEFAQAAPVAELPAAKARLWQTWRTHRSEDPDELRAAFRDFTGHDLEEATAEQLDALADHVERAPEAKNVRAMHAAYRAAGITDRDDRLAHMSATLGRDLTTSADLTADEVATLTRTLKEGTL